MREVLLKLVILFVISINFSFNLEAKAIRFDNNSDLIYGKDDRYEVEDYPDTEFIEKSRSIAIRIPNKRLVEDRTDPTLINFPFRKLKNSVTQICRSERFLDQYSVGDCSGFLVAPHILLTAGHCMQSLSECTGNKWVFDFKTGTKQFQKSNVYTCKKILSQKYVNNEKEVNDYALIELDRSVDNRAPLTLRKRGHVFIHTPLVVIGHPLGLPMKITDGARVSRMNDIEQDHFFNSWWLRRNYFTANLDAYAGNSGSPVFNKNTGKVEGILIQGADDFVFNYETQCLESLHLSNSHHNTYEKVMRITKIPNIF